MLNYYMVSGAGGRLWNILYRMPGGVRRETTAYCGGGEGGGVVEAVGQCDGPGAQTC